MSYRYILTSFRNGASGSGHFDIHLAFFLHSAGLGECLSDRPSQEEYVYPEVPAGELFIPFVENKGLMSQCINCTPLPGGRWIAVCLQLLKKKSM